MNLLELDQRENYGGFYVPAFQVKMAGQDLVRDLNLAVTSVEVDLRENRPKLYSFPLKPLHNMA